MSTIQFRRNTAAAAAASNPTLAAGEPGFETDTGLVKIGDGSTAWASLAYVGLSGHVTAGALDYWDAGTTPLAIGGATGVWASAADGVLTLAGGKTAGSNENLTLDFETTANTVAIASGTGVTTINFGSLILTTTGDVNVGRYLYLYGAAGTTAFGNSGVLKWPGGSLLIEQTTAAGEGGTDRMLYLPNGDRFEVLNEAGNNFIVSFQYTTTTFYTGGNSRLALSSTGAVIAGNCKATSFTVGTAAGIDATVALAKITAGGTDGSMTITKGIVTAYTAPT